MHGTTKTKSFLDDYTLPSVALQKDLAAVLGETGLFTMLRFLQEERSRI